MTTSDLIHGALSWLATYALHSTLFLGLAWGLTALRRPRVNRNRERVWKLALVGGVVSASLQVGLGARAPFGHIEWDWARPVASRSARVPASEPDLLRRTEPGPGPIRNGVDPLVALPAWTQHGGPATKKDDVPRPTSAAAPGSTRQARASSPPTATRPATPREVRRESTPRTTPALVAGARRVAGSLRERWPDWILASWTAAGLLGLAGFAFSWAALRRHLLGREPLAGGPLVEKLERLRAKAGVKRRIRLSVSGRIQTPFSTGWLRPEICLPRAVQSSLSPAQQEVLLAHELAHLVRRDPAWFALSFLFERLFFFQPLNRLARRNLSELAEVACDDWAVRWTGARLALASCLTEVAGWVVGERPRALALPGLAGSRSRLGQRVERLLDDRRSPAGEPPTPWWPTIAAGALSLAVLAVPGVSAQRTRSVPEPIGPGLRPANRQEEAATRARSAAAPDRSTPLTDDLANQRELEGELALLEAELAALHAELEARDLHQRFSAALTELETRLDELRTQHARARALLERLANPEPPTGGQPPPAAGPASTALPGEHR